jgi:hypothetical protein
MNTTFTSLAAAAATVLLAGVAPTAAHAGEQQGVQCPSGATVQISNANKTLKCVQTVNIDRPAVCSPVVFQRNGDVIINVRVRHDTNGRDVCVMVGGTATAAPQFVPLPGDPSASAFTQVALPGTDVFRATRTVFVYPVGGPIYNVLDDESKGVTCPSGFDGDVSFGGRGIRCDKQVMTRAADCDFLFSFLRDNVGTRDRCTLNNQPGPTKPQGMTHVQKQIENGLSHIQWTLDTRPGTDRWLKKEFSFPRSRG